MSETNDQAIENLPTPIVVDVTTQWSVDILPRYGEPISDETASSLHRLVVADVMLGAMSAINPRCSKRN